MSFSISAITSQTVSFDPQSSAAAVKTPAIKPTATQQIHQLASAGQSATSIASSLGIPVSQVDSALGITSSSTSQASVLAGLSSRLSVHA